MCLRPLWIINMNNTVNTCRSNLFVCFIFHCQGDVTCRRETRCNKYLRTKNCQVVYWLYFYIFFLKKYQKINSRLLLFLKTSKQKEKKNVCKIQDNIYFRLILDWKFSRSFSPPCENVNRPNNIRLEATPAAKIQNRNIQRWKYNLRKAKKGHSNFVNNKTKLLKAI